MVISTEYQGHPIRVLGNPINLSSTPEDKRRQFTSPPSYGQHTEELLSQLLGYSLERIAQLKKERIIC
jgi:formyl-CoA transferase